MRDESSPYFSRVAIVSERQKAWAVDGRFHMFVYDGKRFWRRRDHSTRYTLVPGRKTPEFGWMHEAGCDCRLCAHAHQESVRAA